MRVLIALSLIVGVGPACGGEFAAADPADMAEQLPEDRRTELILRQAPGFAPKAPQIPQRPLNAPGMSALPSEREVLEARRQERRRKARERLPQDLRSVMQVVWEMEEPQ